MKKITIIIPCRNEELGIDQVLASMPRTKLAHAGYTIELMVIDNASTDNTVHIARQRGAKVIQEVKRGKGNAVLRGFRAIDPSCSYVVMMDGDHTYKPNEILRMIEPLENGFCDIVAGSRLSGKITDGSFNKVNRLGNWFFTFLVRTFYITNITDTLTGYFAFKKKVIDALIPYITASDFTIEMEIVTRAAKMGFPIYSVPITYGERVGQSKLRAFGDGYKILTTFVRNWFWTPPKKYRT